MMIGISNKQSRLKQKTQIIYSSNIVPIVSQLCPNCVPILFQLCSNFVSILFQFDSTNYIIFQRRTINTEIRKV